MANLNGSLTTAEETLLSLHNDTDGTNATLDALTDEAEQLEQSVKDLRQMVYDIKNANIQGGDERRTCQVYERIVSI